MRQSVITLGILEQLRQLRERKRDEITGKLSQQKQLCKNYDNNINILTSLSDSSAMTITLSAQMSNQANFKANIQRVIDWQKQEHALAIIKQRGLQQEWVEQACREKTLSIVLERQQAELKLARQQQEQKQMDAQAIQSWLRNTS